MTKKALIPLAVALPLGGLVYPFLFAVPHDPVWHPHLNGFLVGILIGCAMLYGEIFLFTRIRRIRFLFFVIIQTTYYILAINAAVFCVVITHNVLAHAGTFASETSSGSLVRFFQTDELLMVNRYCLALVFGVSFFRLINRMLGQHALFFFLAGKYHTPVDEERVFMFLDVKGSTTIAEKLGHTRFHAFLNDLFYDITPAIVESRGEICMYIGDEVVITWPKERGLRDANCIQCYVRVTQVLEEIRERYEKKYGIAPEFKAGCHLGMVTAGLIGDIKRDLVYLGDTVNTAARIRSECSAVNRDFLVSGNLLSRLPSTHVPEMENMGKILLRGKAEEIELFAIKTAA